MDQCDDFLQNYRISNDFLKIKNLQGFRILEGLVHCEKANLFFYWSDVH